MEIDMKKLETAITYIQRISEGNNPINNLPADEDSILNNPNVIRCMYFVKEVLEEVKRNNGQIGKKSKKKELLDFPTELLSNFKYEKVKSITKFVNQINELIDEDVYKKVSYKLITDWLKENGYLQEENSIELGKKVSVSTEKGIQIGIHSEITGNMNGVKYMSITYDEKAQNFIVKNMDKILDTDRI